MLVIEYLWSFILFRQLLGLLLALILGLVIGKLLEVLFEVRVKQFRDIVRKWLGIGVRP